MNLTEVYYKVKDTATGRYAKNYTDFTPAGTMWPSPAKAEEIIRERVHGGFSITSLIVETFTLEKLATASATEVGQEMGVVPR